MCSLFTRPWTVPREAALFRPLTLPILVLSLAAGLAVTPAATAQTTTTGIEPPQSLQPFDQGEPLTLAGCATRDRLWMELYTVVMYLPQSDMRPDAILDPTIPKAVRLYPVYEGTIPQEIPESWSESLGEQLSPDQMITVGEFYRQVSSDDVATIAYQPGQGNVLMVNDRIVARTDDDQPIQAMLRMWIGEDPISEEMAYSLLGAC